MDAVGDSILTKLITRDKALNYRAKMNYRIANEIESLNF